MKNMRKTKFHINILNYPIIYLKRRKQARLVIYIFGSILKQPFLYIDQLYLFTDLKQIKVHRKPLNVIRVKLLCLIVLRSPRPVCPFYRVPNKSLFG